jgi:hypothetical protein
MCWVTQNKENARLRRAIEDIPVYKVVRKSLLSYYKNYSYILNEVRIAELDNPSHTKYLSGAEDWKIRSGFHSYSMNCKVNLVKGQTSLYVRILKLNDNLVAVDCYERNDTCMLECIIPKDSVYFLNEEGEYVSDHILPLKVRNW